MNKKGFRFKTPQSLLIFPTILILVLGCHKSTNTQSPEPNQPPMINCITTTFCPEEQEHLSFNTNYIFRCDAEDPDGDELLYKWTFTYQSYNPDIWSLIRDTLYSNTDTINWHTLASGDLSVSCNVWDEEENLTEGIELYSVNLPDEFIGHEWRLQMILAPLDTIGIPVEDNYTLQFDQEGYFELSSQCTYRYGESSLISDTLSFDVQSYDILFETCEDNESIIFWTWALFELISYRYQVHEGNLMLFSDDNPDLVLFYFTPNSSHRKPIDENLNLEAINRRNE